MADAPPLPSSELSPSSDPKNRLPVNSFLRLIRFENQSGTLLLLFPSLWALILASHGKPSPLLIGIFVVGAFLMRSAGVILNDLADQSIDQKVTRTRQRPLASGALTRRQAIGFTTLLLLLAFGLVCLLNPLTIALSPMALFLAALYPFAKRFIHIPQFVLGVAFGWGVVMAWAAVQNELTSAAWFLFAGTICWAIAYDTIYALQDKEDDLKIGVKSSAIFFGRYVWLGVAITSGLMAIFIGLAGWVSNLSLLFYVGICAISVFFGFQVWELRREQTPSRYFNMFKQHVWIGGVVLVAILLGTL